MSRGPWNHYWIIKEIFFFFFHEKMLAPPPPHLRRQFWLCPRERKRIIKEIFFFHEKILAPHLPPYGKILALPLIREKGMEQREGEGKILKPPLYYFWKFMTLFMWAPKCFFVGSIFQGETASLDINGRSHHRLMVMGLLNFASHHRKIQTQLFTRRRKWIRSPNIRFSYPRALLNK